MKPKPHKPAIDEAVRDAEARADQSARDNVALHALCRKYERELSDQEGELVPLRTERDTLASLVQEVAASPEEDTAKRYLDVRIERGVWCRVLEAAAKGAPSVPTRPSREEFESELTTFGGDDCGKSDCEPCAARARLVAMVYGKEEETHE